MPLTPAMRPVSSINMTAASPISAPPIAAEIGVKLAIASPRNPSRRAGRGDNMRASAWCRNVERPAMDFTLSPEIEDVRLRTRRFIEEQVLPLEDRPRELR